MTTIERVYGRLRELMTDDFEKVSSRQYKGGVGPVQFRPTAAERLRRVVRRSSDDAVDRLRRGCRERRTADRHLGES